MSNCNIVTHATGNVSAQHVVTIQTRAPAARHRRPLVADRIARCGGLSHPPNVAAVARGRRVISGVTSPSSDLRIERSFSGPRASADSPEDIVAGLLGRTDAG